MRTEALLQPDGRVREEGVGIRPNQEPQMRECLHALAHEEDLAPGWRSDGGKQRRRIAGRCIEVKVAIRGSVVGVVAHADAIEHRLSKGRLGDGWCDRVRDYCNRRRSPRQLRRGCYGRGEHQRMHMKYTTSM